MSAWQETVALRQKLAAMAATPEWELLASCDLLREKRLPTLQGRAVRKARNLLSTLRITPPYVTPYPWQATLKHAPRAEHVRPLLIWALDYTYEELRQACTALQQRLAYDNTLAPVLITNVADFAFFSRLGWLVEYVPKLGDQGAVYQDRKIRYLAWRYRDALMIPISAITSNDEDWKRILK